MGTLWVRSVRQRGGRHDFRCRATLHDTEVKICLSSTTRFIHVWATEAGRAGGGRGDGGEVGGGGGGRSVAIVDDVLPHEHGW